MTIDSGKPKFNHYHYSYCYSCAYCHCYSYPSSSFYSYSYCYYTGATFAPSATLGIITTRRRCSAIGMRRIRFWQMSALAFGVTNNCRVSRTTSRTRPPSRRSKSLCTTTKQRATPIAQLTSPLPVSSCTWRRSGRRLSTSSISTSPSGHGRC